MIQLLIDENFDQRILRGLRLRIPELDYVVVQKAGMSGLADPHLLEWAARHNRIIVTHDVNTLPNYANERMKQGFAMPGLILVPDNLEIGSAIADLEMILECSGAADLDNQIQYLPL